jgi:CheY-like chemotaxis protein
VLERERLEVAGDACNTAEALQKTDELSPDVVLADVALGRESGLELARRLAASEAGQSIPVILISTHADEDPRSASGARDARSSRASSGAGGLEWCPLRSMTVVCTPAPHGLSRLLFDEFAGG